MKKFFWFFLLPGVILLTGCPSPEDTADDPDMNDTIPTETEDEWEMGYVERDGITVMFHDDSPTFPGATLNLTYPEAGGQIEPGNVTFEYEVTNYELGAQTEDANENGFANAPDGQHIHVILNNEPYMAHYEPRFSEELEPGRYVVLSFLSRSYHESLKHNEAYDLRQFTVGETDEMEIDLEAPHIFFSRPKNSYIGVDAQRILFDFYLVNTDLTDGHYVIATINGTEFRIDRWTAYAVEGLPMGENTFRIALFDQYDNMVNSPFNDEERTITLSDGDTDQPQQMGHGH